MAKKTPVEFTAFGFITENHWDDVLLGRNEWKWADHFGMTHNADGSATISADRLNFAKYTMSRGINESVQNSYQAHKKGTGYAPRKAAFDRRVADLMAGIWERAKTTRTEAEIDLDAETLRLVIAKSLIREFGITPKEAAALVKSADYAARYVAERAGIDATELLDRWKSDAEEQIAKELAEIGA